MTTRMGAQSKEKSISAKRARQSANEWRFSEILARALPPDFRHLAGKGDSICGIVSELSSVSNRDYFPYAGHGPIRPTSSKPFPDSSRFANHTPETCQVRAEISWKRPTGRPVAARSGCYHDADRWTIARSSASVARSQPFADHKAEIVHNGPVRQYNAYATSFGDWTHCRRDRRGADLLRLGRLEGRLNGRPS